MKSDTVPCVAYALSWKEIDLRVSKFLGTYRPELLNTPQAFPCSEFFEFDLEETIGFTGDVQELPAKYEGWTNPKTKEIVLPEHTYLALEAEEGRARFTFAHELGHAILHANIEVPTMNKRGGVFRKDIRPYRDPEAQANVFAACLLMPTKHVVRAMREHEGTRQELVAKISKTFKVSFQAAAYRIDGIEKFA